jgi:hypothetical protein
MGFVKGSLSFFLGALLLLSFIVGNLFLTLSLSTTPESLNEELASNFDTIVEKAGEDSNLNITKEVDKRMPQIESYCQNNTEFVFSQQGYTIDIPCEVALQGEEAIVEEGISDVINEVYYAEHTCEDFVKCLLSFEDPLVLVSEEAKDYWQGKYYLTLIASIILIIIMFFTVSQISGLFTIIGVLLALSSLPFAVINKLFSLFGGEYLQFASILFSQANNVFLMALITGIIVFGFGMALKFMSFGGVISEKLSNWKPKKFKKKSLKEE